MNPNPMPTAPMRLKAMPTALLVCPPSISVVPLAQSTMPVVSNVLPPMIAPQRSQPLLNGLFVEGTLPMGLEERGRVSRYSELSEMFTLLRLNSSSSSSISSFWSVMPLYEISWTPSFTLRKNSGALSLMTFRSASTFAPCPLKLATSLLPAVS